MFAVIQFWRKGLQVRLIAGLLALYLFDVSVDFQHARDLEKDLSVNEIESITELVLEEIANLENLFDEHHESDREPITKVSTSLVYIVPLQLSLKTTVNTQEKEFQFTHEYAYYSAPFSILTPPPRQA